MQKSGIQAKFPVWQQLPPALRGKSKMSIVSALFGNYSKRELKRIQPICDNVLALEEEYKKKSDAQLRAMINEIREDTARMILTVRIRTKEEPKREQVATPTSTSGDGTDVKQPVRKGKKVGRNDPCPCGSGKKYKHCCGRNE